MLKLKSPYLTWERIAHLAPIALFLAVYLPTAGHGFIRDDYRWVLSSRVRSVSDFADLLHRDDGFYRPVVALTFTVNEWLFGIDPLGYGLTNVALALVCFWAIVSLAGALGLPRGASWLAGSLWLLNFHFMRMAVLWISGRTSLVVTLFAVLAARAIVRGQLAWATVCIAAAIFAKEEAVLLPLILLIWLALLRRSDRRPRISIASWVTCGALVEVLYFAARAQTSAMTPATAPEFYQYTFSVSRLVENALAYTDRSTTLAAVVTLIAGGLLGWSRPGMGALKTILACAGVWLVVAFVPTVLLPVRSDLYACLPAVGACLIGAALCGHMWQHSTPSRRQKALVCAILLLLFLSPVYYLRASRWVRAAEFATNVLDDLQTMTASLPQGAHVVITDDRRDQRANLAAVFGTLLNQAYTLRTGRILNLWIAPALDDAASAGLYAPCSTCVDLRLWVAGGRLALDAAK